MKCLKKRTHELTQANRLKCLKNSRQLLRKYPHHMVDFAFFLTKGYSPLHDQVTSGGDLAPSLWGRKNFLRTKIL